MTTDLRIGVIGCGYLGATTASCLASLGFHVIAQDISEERIAALSAGQTPFFEPGLDELVASGVESGRLEFTHDLAKVADHADAIFLCLGTPQAHGELQADLSQFESACAALFPLLSEPVVVIGKSTTPVGSAARFREEARALAPAGDDLELCWNPEFLQEGNAIRNTLHPDRIVIGLHPDDQRSEDVVRRIFATPIAEDQIPVITTDLQTAELVKASANAFLATKISFINAMSEVCAAAGGDVVTLSEALSHDVRIGGQFLKPGLGFGGGCLPKDIRAFMARASEIGVPHALGFLHEVDMINRRCREHVVALAESLLGGDVREKRITILGAAFKPGSDDIRDSPALDVAGQLHLAGADVVVHDPRAIEPARRERPKLDYCEDLVKACHEADLVMLLTDWADYVELDPASLVGIVANPVIIDARHCLDPAVWQAAGFDYRSLGRGQFA